MGTIENHPESTSESDTGSFTLTRQQRPQPQAIGSKRRPRNAANIKNQEKIRNIDLNNSLRLTESQFQQLNESLHQQSPIRMNDLSHCSRMNDSAHSRLNESLRMNESRLSDPNHSRLNDSNHRMNESRLSELNSSKRMEHLDENRIHNHISPIRNHGLHPRQSSSDSNTSHKNNPNPEFFVPPPPSHSPLTPLTPNTEESVISDDEVPKPEKPETSKCLGPDSQYEVARDNKELKANHHHCYSDTNTMDSGWQSGSEKHITD